MEDPTQRVVRPLRAVRPGMTARPVESTDNDVAEMRDMISFYGPVGLDGRMIEGVTRLAIAVETSDDNHVAVRRLDLRRLLSWLDHSATTYRRAIPTLAISDDE